MSDRGPKTIPLTVLEQPVAAGSGGSRTVAVVSLGCPKNQVDSEVILGNLKHSRVVDDAAEADTIVINTCGFIESAKQESIQAIVEAIKLKQDAARRGIRKEVIVTGCLSERYRQELTDHMPEVDAFFGVNEFDKVTERIEGHYQQVLFTERVLLNQRHYAYLKISEGCNQRCSFCYIPMIRGNLVSKSVEDNVTEARRLAGLGVRELILVSQDTSSYGYDFDRKTRRLRQNHHLIHLLEKLSGVEGIDWIRVMYVYPSLFSDDLVRFIGQNEKICKYVDMPLQHISDRILTSMRRHTTKAATLALLEKLRADIPGVCIRTSFIAGYPGETDEDFQELSDFVEAFRFDRMGVFTYSEEEGTHAATLKPRIPKKIKLERYNRLMELQRQISLEKNMEKIGRTMKVIVDMEDAEHFVARSQADAPEIDNEILIPKSPWLAVGQMVDVTITDAVEYDLMAELSVP